MDELDFRYVECDIPEGMTLDEWRCRGRVPARRRRPKLFRRFRRR